MEGASNYDPGQTGSGLERSVLKIRVFENDKHFEFFEKKGPQPFSPGRAG